MAIAGVVVPAVVVISLFFASVATLPAVAPSGKNAQMTIDVVGRQWFWDVYYRGRAIRTANEIHIPVGVPVEVRVSSRDVIHSLWVPRLNRKIDLIPGQTNAVVFDADQPGSLPGAVRRVLRSRAREHGAPRRRRAARAVRPLAREPGETGSPRPAASAPSSVPDAAAATRSPARPRRAASAPTSATSAQRMTIGAGTLTNTPEHLADWIRDPQRIKPGNKMPNLGLPEPEIQALVRYLESLK